VVQASAKEEPSQGPTAAHDHVVDALPLRMLLIGRSAKGEGNVWPESHRMAVTRACLHRPGGLRNAMLWVFLAARNPETGPGSEPTH
jgi:hypothetical protein